MTALVTQRRWERDSQLRDKNKEIDRKGVGVDQPGNEQGVRRGSASQRVHYLQATPQSWTLAKVKLACVTKCSAPGSCTVTEGKTNFPRFGGLESSQGEQCTRKSLKRLICKTHLVFYMGALSTLVHFDAGRSPAANRPCTPVQKHRRFLTRNADGVDKHCDHDHDHNDTPYIHRQHHHRQHHHSDCCDAARIKTQRRRVAAKDAHEVCHRRPIQYHHPRPLTPAGSPSTTTSRRRPTAGMPSMKRNGTLCEPLARPTDGASLLQRGRIVPTPRHKTRMSTCPMWPARL